MRTTPLTAFFLAISIAVAIASPPQAGLEARACIEDGQCSQGGPADRGASCSALNCCSGQKSGAGNGVGAPYPIQSSLRRATVMFSIALTDSL